MNISDLDFFFGNMTRKKKYRLAKCPILCRAKDQGGMRIMNLELQNRCPLSKWLFKLYSEKTFGRI